jgi:MFS family permease
MISGTALYRRTIRVLVLSQILAGAGLAAAAAPADSAVLLALALGLLGLGWNFGLVGGTALLTDAVPLSRRARTRGTVDVAVALSGAAGGMTSGVLVAATSFAALSLTGGLLGLALLSLLGTRQRCRGVIRALRYS